MRFYVRFFLLLLVLLFVATGAFANTVKLAWDRNVEPDVTGYNVYRSTTAGSGYVKVNATVVAQPASGAVPTYTDQTPLNQKYFYVVRAVNQAGLESGNSNEVSANPLPPGSPTNLNIAGLTTASILVDGQEVATAVIGDPLQYTLVVQRQTPPRTTVWPIEVDFH
jgi:fibronectin type 3 domain-containing protein